MKKYRDEWSADSGVNVVKAERHVGPESLAELRQVVRDATERGQRVKAHGAGHSYSDITQTDGVLVDLRLLNKVFDLDTSVLKPERELRSIMHLGARTDERRKKPNAADYLVSFEAGITIERMNEQLWARGLAAANLGSYDQQSFAGATSTGTHGSSGRPATGGMGLGPIHDSIRSITLVTTNGDCHRIEPTNGITDPRRWRNPDGIQLRQDDDWFNAVLVSMGTMGIIYSVIVQAQDAYWLHEERTVFDRWQDARDAIRSKDILERFRHVELYVNPNPVKGKHVCVLVTRKVEGLENVNRDYNAKVDGSRPEAIPLKAIALLEDQENRKKALVPALLDALTGNALGLLQKLAKALRKRDADNVPEDARSFLADFVNLLGKEWAAILNVGLEGQDIGSMRKMGYQNRSYKVFGLDFTGGDAYGIEASFPYEGLDDLDERISIIFQFFKDEMERGRVATTPMGVRFVKASNAYLSPDQGRDSVRFEVGMIAGTTDGKRMLVDLQERLQRAGGRLHWGLHLKDLDVSQALMRRQYPMYDRWLRVYQALNSRGTFNNAFTQRMQISMPMRG